MKRLFQKLTAALCFILTAAMILPSNHITAAAANGGQTEITCDENTLKCTQYGSNVYYLNSCTDKVAEFIQWSSNGKPTYKVEISVIAGSDDETSFADLKEGIYESSQEFPILSVKYYKWYWYVDEPSTGLWRNDQATASYTVELVNIDEKTKHIQGTIEAKFGYYSKSGLFIGIELKDGQFDFTIGDTYTVPVAETAPPEPPTPPEQPSASKSSTQEPSSLPDIETASPSKNTAALKKSSSDSCEYCGGSGYCHVCINGECDKCFGAQYLDCPNCFNGMCSYCAGSGEIDTYSNGKIKTKKCTRCNNGDCRKCKGEGVIECSRCHGTGECVSCGGSTICRYCKGKY